MKKKILLSLCSVLFFCNHSNAQKIALSTNIVEWANFGTVNLECGVSVARHFSVSAGAKYNPWVFRQKSGYPTYNRQTSGYIGMRYWPWYVFSGWWIGAKGQYMQYSRTGIWRPALQTGTVIGAGLSFGYTLMLHENLNIEFGAGCLAGRQIKYALYECPECMQERESGPRNYIGLDDISITLMYVF